MKRFLPIAVSCIVWGVLMAQVPEAQNKFRLAQTFEQAGEYERAARLYEDLVAADRFNFMYFDGLRRCYLQLKEYDAAAALCLNRLRIEQGNFTIIASLGSIYYLAGNIGRADSVWESILTLAPQNQGAYRVVAATQAENRLFDRAIQTYTRGRQALNDPSIFASDLAMLFSLTMNYAEATREYISMLRMSEHQLEFVQSRLGLFTGREEGLTAAISVTEEASARSEKSVVILRLLQWLYLEAKRYDRALTVAKRIESLVNSGGMELFSFAQRAFKERAYAAAALAFKAALDKGSQMPKIPEAKFGYVRAIEELSLRNDSLRTDQPAGQMPPAELQPTFQHAITLYLDLAAEYPRTEIGAQSLYRVGIIRFTKFFDLDGALKLFDSVLTVAPGGQMIPAVMGTMGDIAVAQGRLDYASQQFSGVLASPYAQPVQRSQAQFRLAEVQYFRRNFDSALTMLQQLTKNLAADESNDALRLQYFISENKSTSAQALNDYAAADLLIRGKKYGEAISLLNSIIRTYPSAPLVDDALLREAECLIILQRYNDALMSYQKLLTDYPKSIFRDKALFNIGELYQFHLSDKQKAIQAYEEILVSSPQSLFAEEARKRIRVLRGDSI